MNFLIGRVSPWCKIAICSFFVVFALLLGQRAASDAASSAASSAVSSERKVVDQTDRRVAEKVSSSKKNQYSQRQSSVNQPSAKQPAETQYAEAQSSAGKFQASQSLKTETQTPQSQTPQSQASQPQAPQSSQEAQSNFYSDPFDTRALSDSSSSFSYLLIRMMVVMAIVIAAAFFLLRYLKRRQGAAVGDQTLIRTIVEHPISLNSKVQIIKIVQDYFMLVITGESAPYVRKIEDKVSIDEIKIVENQKTVSNPTFFKDLLTMRYQGNEQSYLKLPKALSMTRMMSEKIKKKQNWSR